MKIFAIAVLLAVCSTSSQASSQPSQLQPDSSTTDLLDGRLNIRLPDGVAIEDIKRGFLTEPESWSETVIDAGAFRITIVAYELFARTSKDFESEAQKDEQTRIESTRSPAKVSFASWPLANSLRGYAYVPVSVPLAGEPNLIMGLYVARSDGTVQLLTAYLDSKTKIYFAEASALAKTIFKTIAEGKKELNSVGGDRELLTYSREGAFQITVPDNYVATMQQGPDYLVHRIHKITELGDTPTTVEIYVGNLVGPDIQSGKKIKGHVLNKTIYWHEKTVNISGKDYLSNVALVPIGPFQYSTAILYAVDSHTMEELRKVISTLKIVPQQSSQ